MENVMGKFEEKLSAPSSEYRSVPFWSWNDDLDLNELQWQIHEMKEKGFDREGLFEVENLEEAVSLAKQICRQGHSVVLSPAASSYDHFKNFEERGRIFEELALHGS